MASNNWEPQDEEFTTLDISPSNEHGKLEQLTYFREEPQCEPVQNKEYQSSQSYPGVSKKPESIFDKFKDSWFLYRVEQIFVGITSGVCLVGMLISVIVFALSLLHFLGSDEYVKIGAGEGLISSSLAMLIFGCVPLYGRLKYNSWEPEGHVGLAFLRLISILCVFCVTEPLAKDYRSSKMSEYTDPVKNYTEEVYWDKRSSYFHADFACDNLKSEYFQSGTVEDAVESGHGTACPDCFEYWIEDRRNGDK